MIQQSDRILTIGPDPKAKGGMASVIAFLAPMYTPFHLVVTYKETSKICERCPENILLLCV